MLLLIPLAEAKVETYSNYSDLELNLKIESTADLIYEKADSKVDYVDINLHIFPREYKRQVISRKEVYSEPKGKIKVADSVNYRWEDINVENLSFGLDYDVRVNSYIERIDKKVMFPLTSLENDLIVYTKAGNYIDIDEDIMNTASEIVEGETDYYLVVFKIADWVKSNIEYDLSTLTAEVVQKSSWVLQNKQGVCDELTNLFISMLRSVNIPARFVTGVVYTNVDYSFGAHGWAEVYFPNYGWVPFDVTFGQYGWIDPSHVKLSDTKDSGNPSIDYSWRSYKTKLEAGELDIKATVIAEGISTMQLVNIDISPLKKEVGLGSYVPLQVEIKNPQNYYIPLTLYITKAPGLIGSNTKNVLLRPKEEKSVFWILPIGKDFNENYIYASEIEVVGDFSNTATSKISYAKGYSTYSLNWAESRINELKGEENKEFFSDIGLSCKSDKKKYYQNESIGIACKLENRGNVNLQDVKVCLKDDCRKYSLRISENRDAQFNLFMEEGQRVILSAENDKMIKYEYLDIGIVKVPKVEITDFGPSSVDYGENAEISFSLASSAKASNTVLYTESKELRIGDLSKKQELKMPVDSRSIKDGKINIKVVYEDELGKAYEEVRSFNIQIENIPWYTRFWRRFLG